MLLSVCALAAGASLQPSPKPALPTRSSLLELRGGASLKQQLKEEISVKEAPSPSAVGGLRQPRARLSHLGPSSASRGCGRALRGPCSTAQLGGAYLNLKNFQQLL